MGKMRLKFHSFLSTHGEGALSKFRGPKRKDLVWVSKYAAIAVVHASTEG